GQRAKLALAPQIYRYAGRRQQRRLGDQQDLRGVPDEHERRERQEDGVEVVAEQVGDAENRVVDELASAVAPNGLVLHREIERVACVVPVPVHGYGRVGRKGEKGQRACQRAAQAQRQERGAGRGGGLVLRRVG